MSASGGTARPPEPPSNTRSPAMPNRKTPASLPPTGTEHFHHKADMPPASREGESAVCRSWRLAFRRLSSPAGA